jgi:DNA polymerase-1
VHPTFHQTGTSTGRLSCSNPNLQNIPIRTEVGRQIRKAFVAPEGHVLLSADYSQIELRVLAHITGDEALIGDFRKGEDIHSRTAERIFGKPRPEITVEDRRTAKTVNFGITYGISAHGLSEALKIPREEAAVIIGEYDRSYPRVREWQERVIEEAVSRGYVTTLMGRRRYLYESEARSRRGFNERMFINAPIQGTAADLIKKAMIDIHRDLEGSGACLLLQIHDELLLEVPESEIEAVRERVKSRMEGALELSVPLVAEIGTGQNWLEAH